MKLNIIGPYFGTSGYANHVKGLANALHELGHDVRIDSPKPQGWEASVLDGELSMLTKPTSPERITVMVATPPHWRIALADKPKRFVGFVVWEGSHVPKYWVDYMADPRVDQIWVPSKHVRNAIDNTVSSCNSSVASAIRNKIRVVPHGFDPTIFKPAETAPTGAFTFLVNKGWAGGDQDRGGVQYAIQAFRQEFKADEDVKLFLKINPAYIRINNHQAWLSEQMSFLGVKKGEGPRIEVSTEELSQEQIADLYRSADVFVNATRAEGFGLTGLEAKGCGLITIQTAYGGQCDYLGPYDKVIPYELEKCLDVDYEGSYWALPDIDELRASMRRAFTTGRDHCRREGLMDVERVVKHWTWKEAAKTAVEHLRNIKEA